jgi:hypothetical protein
MSGSDGGSGDGRLSPARDVASRAFIRAFSIRTIQTLSDDCPAATENRTDARPSADLSR